MKTSNGMKKIGISVLALLLPSIAFAQNLTGFETLVRNIGKIVNLAIPIIFAIAILGFFWGLVKYIFGSEHDKEAAKKTMLWGVVAIFVMASVWGLVRFLNTALDINQENAPVVGGLEPRS